jgi:hypothetical protein
MPDQMMLQIHESIGHPLEMDRILGDERNYAGTSFVKAATSATCNTAPAAQRDLRPDHRRRAGQLQLDDDGTPASKQFLIRDGLLLRRWAARCRSSAPAWTAWPTAAPAAGTARRSTAWPTSTSSRATSLAQLIGGIEHGILMRTNRSWSIDDARNKFQFGCEWGQLIENGELKGVVKTRTTGHLRAVLAQPVGRRRPQYLPGAGHAQLRQGRTQPGGPGRPRLAGLCVPPDRCIRRRRLMSTQQETLVGEVRAALQAGEQFTLGYSAERRSSCVSTTPRCARPVKSARPARNCGWCAMGARRSSNHLEWRPATGPPAPVRCPGQLRQTLPLLPSTRTCAWTKRLAQPQPAGTPLPGWTKCWPCSTRGRDLDLVGIYAAGPISRGFASSFGAFGWHQANSFNFDWSLFHENGQAVKANYAGQLWSADDFRTPAPGPRAAGLPRSPGDHPQARQLPRLPGPAPWTRSPACSAGAVFPRRPWPLATAPCSACTTAMHG